MRTSMTVVATVLGLLSVPGSASAQLGGDPELHRRAMERLEFLVGEWEGDGWILDRTGRIEIRQSEVVRYELDGTILLVEGTARERSGDEIGAVMFNAFAVISWSEGAGYAMRSYLWNGREGSRELEVGQLTRPDGASMTIIEFNLSKKPEG